MAAASASPLEVLAEKADRQFPGHYWQRVANADVTRSLEETGGILEAVPAPGPLVEELLVRREEAQRRLRPLKADQRTALALQAAGYTYGEIASLKSWTYTKVSRCLREGREALASRHILPGAFSLPDFPDDGRVRKD